LDSRYVPLVGAIERLIHGTGHNAVETVGPDDMGPPKLGQSRALGLIATETEGADAHHHFGCVAERDPIDEMYGCPLRMQKAIDRPAVDRHDLRICGLEREPSDVTIFA
jgi:hypothetical protein